ncbi:UNVERIFIED_CONTAM: hypothetical protein H355_006781 [Colinus virginianus]|nr:hypothetical protein H355_006781 [Colinus virginianus]
MADAITIMLKLEKSDLGCGAGGGKNNIDVFRMAGLTFLTNANADDSNEADENCNEVVRAKRSDFEERVLKEGICVAAPLEVQVVKDIFLSIYVPYSVVRGEQIELKGSVYNHRASAIKFCVKIAAGDGICSFGDSAATGARVHNCNFKNLDAGSSLPIIFRILPLELGLHTVNFTLLTTGSSETVVRTLRVMVRKNGYF